ncbi:hypothetical protein [Desulfothermus okinawensis]
MDKDFFTEHKRAIGILQNLKNSPPRVLIIQGGLLKDRLGIAKYYSTLLNCPSKRPPCLKCNICKGILTDNFPDLSILDGEEGSIKIDDVRSIQRDRDLIPREGKYRIYLFNESQNLTLQAANSLLKILEEPGDQNLFVLLAPQKTLLLPTIRSRSFVLTLRWKSRTFAGEDIEKITKGLLDFWENGKGLFNILKGKKVDRDLVKEVFFFLERALIDSLEDQTWTEIARFFENNVSLDNFWNVSYVLEKAVLMADSNISPEDVFYWMAFNLYSIFKLN